MTGKTNGRKSSVQPSQFVSTDLIAPSILVPKAHTPTLRIQDTLTQPNVKRREHIAPRDAEPCADKQVAIIANNIVEMIAERPVP